jgi:hypothetical protein
LFQLVHLAAGAFPRVALYFENSILTPDLKLLSAAAASVDKIEKSGTQWRIDSRNGAGVAWPGAAKVDGKPWPVTDGTTVWLPSGSHTLEASTVPVSPRILDFNGDLQTAVIVGSALQVVYTSSSRAIAVLDKRPSFILLDGDKTEPEVLAAGSNWALMLPRGSHTVSIRFGS